MAAFISGLLLIYTIFLFHFECIYLLLIKATNEQWGDYTFHKRNLFSRFAEQILYFWEDESL